MSAGLTEPQREIAVVACHVLAAILRGELDATTPIAKATMSAEEVDEVGQAIAGGGDL